MAQLVQVISKNIGRFLRYVFPGLFIIGSAGIAYPSWCHWFNPFDGYHLLILATVAILVGNIWYAFHRYGLHQIIDYFMYLIGSKGPSGRKGRRGICSYITDVSEYIVLSFRTDPELPIREHVALRASQMHLMYIAAEALFTFSFLHEPESFFSQYQTLVLFIAGAFFVTALGQNFITRQIDWLSIQSDHKSEYPNQFTTHRSWSHRYRKGKVE